MRWAKFALLLALVAPSMTARGQGPTAQAAPAAAAPKVWITRQRAFSFPVNVPPANVLGGEPAVVELYFSNDRGATWQRYDMRNLRAAQTAQDPRQPVPNAAQPTPMAPFVVHTDRDGEYYFASRILDALNRPLYQPAQLPEQRVIVDTLPPRVEFAVTAGPSGEVQGQWRANDEYLRPDSLMLEYQPAPNQPWRPLAFDRPTPNSTETLVTGQAAWYPETSEHVVSLRATVYDWAGNSTVVARTAAFSEAAPNTAPPLAAAPQSSAPTAMAPISPVTPSAVGGSGMAAANPQAGAAVGAPPAIVATPSAAIPPPAVVAAPIASAPPSPAPPSPNVEPIPWPDDSAAPPRTPSLASEYPYRRPETSTTSQAAAPPLLNDDRPATNDAPGQFAYPNMQAPPTRVTPVADAGAPRRLLPSPAPPLGPHALPGGEKPRMTNARKFNLDYDVSSVGPQGVAKVELWLTRDGGQTWQAWAVDPDRESPMEVSLADEGVYGFRVVVTGRNGLSGQIPTAGEMADVWIGIDTTTPFTRLTAAQYGAGRQAGQLDIRWEADDVMLAARPVTLLFSETPHGPWTIIATGLPNTGNYNWPVDPRTPKNIYLRIEVRDEAGNLGIDQLREPITLQGLEPKARVRGIQPLEGVGFHPRDSVLFR